MLFSFKLELHVSLNLLTQGLVKVGVMCCFCSVSSKAGQYGQNLYHNIFLNFGQYDIIPISIWTLFKEASLKLARMPTTDVCSYTFMRKNYFPSLWTPPIKLYNILGRKNSTNILMFTFYLYLAFIQTINVKSRSNKHLRLTLLILTYLTLLLTKAAFIWYKIQQKQ